MGKIKKKEIKNKWGRCYVPEPIFKFYQMLLVEVNRPSQHEAEGRMKLSFLFIFSFQRIWGYQHFFTFFDLAISITFFKPQYSDLKNSLCVLGEGGFVSFDCLPLLLPAYLTINVNISFCLVSIILVEQFGIESWNLTSRPEVGMEKILY